MKQTCVGLSVWKSDLNVHSWSWSWEKCTQFPESYVLCLIPLSQVLDGLAFLHSKHIIHLDIKVLLICDPLHSILICLRIFQSGGEHSRHEKRESEVDRFRNCGVSESINVKCVAVSRLCCSCSWQPLLDGP